MDKPKDTIRVLDNFDITLSMDSRADLGRQVTSIDIAIQPLVFRVSFHDIILINSIINRAIEMSNRGTVPVPPSAPLVISNKASVVRKPSQTSTNNASPGARRLSVGNRELKAQVIMSKETVSLSSFQSLSQY